MIIFKLQSSWLCSHVQHLGPYCRMNNNTHNSHVHIHDDCRERKKSSILVYKGEGSSDESRDFLIISLKRAVDLSHHTVSFISPEQIKEGSWTKTCKAIIFGGGYDLGFMQAVGRDGTTKIRDFVEDGGCYLGLCAGAYWACDYIEFDKGGPLQVVGERFLKFYPGMCLGPAFPGFQYNTKKGVHASPVHYKGVGLFDSYMHGGGFFMQTDATRKFGRLDDNTHSGIDLAGTHECSKPSHKVQVNSNETFSMRSTKQMSDKSVPLERLETGPQTSSTGTCSTKRMSDKSACSLVSQGPHPVPSQIRSVENQDVLALGSDSSCDCSSNNFAQVMACSISPMLGPDTTHPPNQLAEHRTAIANHDKFIHYLPQKSLSCSKEHTALSSSMHKNLTPISQSFKSIGSHSSSNSNSESYTSPTSCKELFNATDLPNVETLGVFTTLEGQPASVVKCSVGKGTAILSSVHLEYHVDLLDRENLFLNPVIHLFQASETARSAAFCDILTRLGIRLCRNRSLL